MQPRTKPETRRSAGEWSRLIELWRRSGESAKVFAASRKLSARTLTWWKWNLSNLKSEALRLVPLEITPEQNSNEDSSGAWEITSAAGHVLRVRDTIATEDLEVVLKAIFAAGRR